ncbi:thioredoxin domain-containing protein [Microbacterium luteum]|uniref:DsbA family protein n=1 Tax=Microbacterium TaxID=33882 RepID=UPI00188791A2|nr:thioredoxin domain-containing protein [Microbacterium luteum]
MKTPLKVTLIAITAVIVLVIGAIIYTINTRPQVSADDNASDALPGARSNSHVLDSAGPDAPTLVEFLDFECEACGALYPYVEEIREQYDGQINYVFRYYPIPSHYNSMNAALAVEAAAQQDRVEDMYHRMFETQAEWGEQQVSEADLFRSFAEELGLDMAAYDEAVADPATRERVEEDFAEGQDMGVQGTPTFFLDGERLELTQLTDLTDALDRALAD